MSSVQPFQFDPVCNISQEKIIPEDPNEIHENEDN